MALRLFQWTGMAPDGVLREGDARRPDVSCAAVFPSTAAFLRATDSPRTRMAYVSVMEIEGREPGNETAAAALAKPGTVFWQDDVRHPRRDKVVCEHPQPERA